MGHKWKGTVEARKLRFLELYEDGASYQEIMTQLGLDEHDLRDWALQFVFWAFLDF